MSQPITAQDLRECSAEFEAHLWLAGGGWMLVKRCVEHPSLTIVEGRQNRRTEPYRIFKVGDRECEMLEDAAGLLTRERDGETLLEGTAS